MLQFANKVVWITGASSGIGEALAYTFAKAGARLVLSARRVAELDRVSKACNSPHVMILPLDVADINMAEDAVQRVLQHYGKIDVLINNAGLSHWSKIKDTSLDVIKRIMDTNFLGGVALTKAVLPVMLKQKSGHVVVISSILGKIVTAKQAAYNASKHAIHGFYDTLRAETAADGIKVLLVCPGFVRTNVAKNSLNKEGQPIGKDNPLIANGLDPMYIAGRVLQGIEKNKEELLLAGGKEKFGVWMKRFAPTLFSKYIAGNKLV